jgi:APA family basic amino acid/polyamine antiporter
VRISPLWVNGPAAGGYVNLPAAAIVAAVTGLLIMGTSKSARANAILVCIKVSALVLFVVLALPVMNTANFHPSSPRASPA